MAAGEYFAQMTRADMRVQFRGGEIAMPQQHLYSAQIRPSFKQMSGKTVAQGMRRNISGNPRGQSVFPDDFPYGLPGEPFTRTPR